MEARLADPVLAAEVGRLRTELMLPSLEIPTICSSANRLRFIVRFFPNGPDSSSAWIKLRGKATPETVRRSTGLSPALRIYVVSIAVRANNLRLASGIAAAR